MTAESVGTVEFVDLDSLLPALIGVSRAPDGRVVLEMDENTTGESGWGGHCEVGLDGSAARRLVTCLQEAGKIASEGPESGWNLAGDVVDYSWCSEDNPQIKPGRLGYVSILARRGVVRILVVPRWEFENFLFTLRLPEASRLLRLLENAIAR